MAFEQQQKEMSRCFIQGFYILRKGSLDIWFEKGQYWEKVAKKTHKKKV